MRTQKCCSTLELSHLKKALSIIDSCPTPATLLPAEQPFSESNLKLLRKTHPDLGKAQGIFACATQLSHLEIGIMATSSHKGTVNFHSYIESGVDPRTGTFSANILLGTLLEPDFDVRLCYSPLNQKDFGFGHGWRIPVTIYNTKSKLLSLGDGRLYEVKEYKDSLTLNGNMGEVHAVKMTQPEGIKITYRDTGVVEWLQRKSDWYACTARISPAGDALYFRWYMDNSESPKITLREAFKATTSFNTVDDENIEKTLLLSVTMDSSKISVIFWPEKEEQRSFSLIIEKNYLTFLKNTSFTPALQWKFGYDESPSPSRLNTIVSPLGKVENVTYSNAEPLYENAPARVATHNTYIENDRIVNGVPKSLSWTDHYSYDLDTYQSMEFRCLKIRGELEFYKNPSAPPLLECTATYYEIGHFLEIEKMEFLESSPQTLDAINFSCEFTQTLPGLLKRTSTSYSDVHYALPISEHTTICDIPGKKNPSTATLTKKYTWDDYGRLTKKTNEDQTTDEYSYIAKNGTESTLLLRHVHTNCDSTITKKYEYSELYGDAYALTAIPRQPSILLYSMSRASTDAPHIETLKSHYFNDPQSFLHGKLARQQTLQPNSDAAIKDEVPTQTTTYDYTLEGAKQRTESSITGFDGSVVTVENVKSIYTGLTLRERDTDGNVSDYSWDALSRLTKITNNSATRYRTEETFTHGIIDNENTYAKVFGNEEPLACFKGYILQRDSTGRKILTGHDQHNHEVQTWIFDETKGEIEKSRKWILAEEKKYDSACRIINHTLIETDDLTTRRAEYKTLYLTPCSYLTYYERATEKYDITHTLIYESNRSRITTYINSDDLEKSLEFYILPELNYHTMDLVRAAAHFTDYDQNSFKRYKIPGFIFKEGKNRCWSRVERVDSRGNVIEIQIYTMNVEAHVLTPVLHSSKTYSYGNQNTVASFKDEYDGLTTFKRDSCNRPSIITRPDASTLEYAYASHSDKPLITQLSVSSAGTTKVLGTQAFDGLDRLTGSESGGRKQSFEYSGSAQAPMKALKPDGKHLQYDVIPELGGAIKSIKAEGMEHTFDYFPDSGLLKEYSDQSGYKSVLAYDSQANVVEERITPLTGQQTTTLSNSFSPTGKCTGFTDAAAKTQTVIYHNGKIVTAQDADCRIDTEYGAFDKIVKQTSINNATKKTLVTEFAYDILGNETSRTITTSGRKDKLVISQTLRKNNQLATRKVVDGKKILRDESFSYNSVDLLTDYACTGNDLPLDGYGKPISRLELTYDALTNVTQCVTHFGEAKDTAAFFYENAKDPCQLSRITHTHEDYEKLIDLSYDANGCMTRNEKGQTLTYDALNRLASLKDGKDTYLYHYDPKGKLTSRTKLKARCEWYYQPGGEYPLLSNQITGQTHTRITRMAEQVTAVVTEADSSTASKVQLIGIDKMNSPVIVLDGDGSSTHKYSPSGNPNCALVVGQSGELYDDVGGFYHLGERQYSPRLFRFTTPDSWSPFGEAGPNCYTYLDPVNCRDPEGHLSGWAWFGIAMGVLAIVLGVATLGASFAAMAAFGATYAAAFATIGAVATIASGAVGIAASAISESNSALSNILEWVSFGLAVVGVVFALSAGFAPGATRMAMRGVRAAAPKLGKAARYAVRARVVEGLQMKPISSVISRTGMAMEMKFIGGSKYAFSTASSVTSGLQSAMSGVFLEAVARIAAQPAIRMVGMTMGMMSLLGLSIGAKQHAQKQAAR